MVATLATPAAMAAPAAIYGAAGKAIEIGFNCVAVNAAFAPLYVSIVACAILTAFCI